MDPDNRNITIPFIEDEDAVSETMEDLLNSNQKYADKRKVFLLKNQEQAFKFLEN